MKVEGCIFKKPYIQGNFRLPTERINKIMYLYEEKNNNTGGIKQKRREKSNNGKKKYKSEYDKQKVLYDEQKVLEGVLAYLPESDGTKLLAKSLIEEYGSIRDLLNSTFDENNSQNLNESVFNFIKSIRAIISHVQKSKIAHKPILGSSKALTDYLSFQMSFLRKEQFRILFLNRKNMLILDEIQGEGTIDHTSIYPREVLRRALELDASALILVHNHPSGDPTPSSMDVSVTKMIIDLARPFDITVYDHIVIGKGKNFSLKAMHLI